MAYSRNPFGGPWAGAVNKGKGKERERATVIREARFCRSLQTLMRPFGLYLEETTKGHGPADVLLDWL